MGAKSTKFAVIRTAGLDVGTDRWRRLADLEGACPYFTSSGFWVQRRLKLRESSAHLVGFIMRRVACDASVVLRASFV